MALSTININTNRYNNICVLCHVYTASIVTRILIVIRCVLIFSLNELMREIKTLFFAMKETCSVIAAEHAPTLSHSLPGDQFM